ncbi:hypothetical protein HMPREF0975_00674 [Actinomyces sp. oral taxon 849 str. F0330]|nr:hypothetical protein HMPREF0975_00674 [Actinomyces sp. oral taxon 849 str. F0330]
MSLAEYVVAHSRTTRGRGMCEIRETVLTTVPTMLSTTARRAGFMAGLGR